ncbi:hypothetical protein BJ138DRAFT_1120661 [Hygrophoropsis aurantiaca]|uniref:Uncharacterized protein n=1 Tax=Hygrophoropsis aurantiaca TaxID=72124 RepID=A0ACB7ZPQ5_9AGAM|nr:hypothetical protein BJ138DRAFT_1120661 [Hygrophoropsis aurantiaca]
MAQTYVEACREHTHMTFDRHSVLSARSSSSSSAPTTGYEAVPQSALLSHHTRPTTPPSSVSADASLALPTPPASSRPSLDTPDPASLGGPDTILVSARSSSSSSAPTTGYEVVIPQSALPSHHTRPTTPLSSVSADASLASAVPTPPIHWHSLPTPPASSRPSLDTPDPASLGGPDTILYKIQHFRDSAADPDGTNCHAPSDICDRLDSQLPDVRLHLTYHPDTQTLSVRKCTSEVHESAAKYLALLEPSLEDWLRQHCSMARVRAAGSARQTLRGGGKKEPDESFFIHTGRKLAQFPSVVLETGYAERYRDLRLDVDDWLLKTDYVLCVIIVWFTPPKDAKDRQNASKWTGALEVYERAQDSGEVVLYGETIYFLPQPAVSPNLILNVRHFLPRKLISPIADQERVYSLNSLIERAAEFLGITLGKRQRTDEETDDDEADEEETGAEEAGKGKGEEGRHKRARHNI